MSWQNDKILHAIMRIFHDHENIGGSFRDDHLSHLKIVIILDHKQMIAKKGNTLSDEVMKPLGINARELLRSIKIRTAVHHQLVQIHVA